MKEYNFPLVFALGAVIAAVVIAMSVVFLLKAIIIKILFKNKSYICNFLYLTLVRLFCQEKFL